MGPTAPMGQAFSPAANANDPLQRKRRLPVQQALQTLSMRLPRFEGAAPPGAIAPGLMMNGRGLSGASDVSLGQTAALIRALTGQSGPSSLPAGARPITPGSGFSTPMSTPAPNVNYQQRPGPIFRTPQGGGVQPAPAPAPAPQPTQVNGGYLDGANLPSSGSMAAASGAPPQYSSWMGR